MEVSRPIFATETEWGHQLGIQHYAAAKYTGAPQIVFLPPPSEGTLYGIVRDYAPSDLLRCGQWRDNGGRFYVDRSHIETSTPEVDTLDDLVAAEIADERVMAETLRALVDDDENVYIDALLGKRCLDHDGNAWGYHENYLIDPRKFNHGRFIHGEMEERKTERAKFAFLGLHLATRGIYAGSGAIRSWNNQTVFVHSQKQSATNIAFHDDTVTIKPVVNLRRVHYGNGDPSVGRMHVVSGDPTLSPWATKMKIGTTMLVIAALEAGYAPDIPEFSDTSLVRCAHFSTRDLTGKRPVLRTRDGERYSTLDAQNAIYDMVATYLTDTYGSVLPHDDDRFVMAEWRKALDDIAKDAMLLADRADWPKRWQVIQAIARREGAVVEKQRDGEIVKVADLNHAKVKLADTSFDRIPLMPNTGMIHKLRYGDKSTWKQYMPPEKLIEQRRHEAPQHLRSASRGAAVAALAGVWAPDLPGYHQDKLPRLWDHLPLQEVARPGENLRMPNPRRRYPAVEATAQRIGAALRARHNGQAPDPLH